MRYQSRDDLRDCVVVDKHLFEKLVRRRRQKDDRTYDIVVNLDVNRLRIIRVAPNVGIVVEGAVDELVLRLCGDEFLQPLEIHSVIRVRHELYFVQPATVDDQVTLEVAIENVNE